MFLAVDPKVVHVNQVHPLACDGVVIRNTRIYSPPAVGNTDGLDPDFCINVLVDNCTIESGDDAIAVRSRFLPGSQILQFSCC